MGVVAKGVVADLLPAGAALLVHARTHPDMIAVVVPPRRVTYAELAERALTVAGGLQARGVRAGSRVGILMPNSLEWIEAFLATALLGAVTVPINTRYGTDEVRYVIEHAQITVMITGGDLDHHRQPATAAPVRLEDTAAIVYTSGTTARPKGCVLSWSALVRTGTARFVERRVDQDRFVIWTPCPLFHTGALLPLIGSVATGSTYVTTGRFDAGEALGLLERELVTNAVPLFPAFTDALLDHPDFAATDLTALRDVLTTGSPHQAERAQRSFAPARLLSAYGMTELCAVCASSGVDEPDDERLEWDGTPFGGVELRIVDHETGTAAAAGVVGEITARGICLFDGYLDDEEATRAAFDADGWFHTGDMGVQHPDGRIAFRGRYKDMLKVGGENVSALEVEAFLGRHPAVRRAEVVGAPDARLGEVPVAFVELEPGATAAEADLLAECEGRIARFKTPRRVWFVEPGAWPMSATKVDKVALRARASAS